ncbi:MAG: hypothetical protein AAFY24_00115 [Pseudomonadota bacterium]
MASPHDYDLETLTAFVRGKLDTARADAIKDAVAGDPALAADIEIIRGVKAAEAERVADVTNVEFGWARLSNAIDATTAPVSTYARWHDARLGLSQVAACAVAAVVLWQVVAVPMLTTAPESSDAYVPATEIVTEQFVLKVMFQTTATEAELRELLLSIDANVTDGPSAIGLYTLTFETENDRARAEAVLKAATNIVDVVQRD